MARRVGSPNADVIAETDAENVAEAPPASVSYTHLTLPTNREV